MEIWKDIKGFEGRYQVSNMGRVKTLKGETWIKPAHLNHWGYPRVQFRISKTSKSKNYAVHRLVAQAFIPNPDGKPEVNHKNGIKTDNRVANLEWCTPAENTRHAVATGLKVGKPNTWTVKGGHNARSKPVHAYKDGALIKTYDCVRGAERDLQVATGQVCKALKGVVKTVKGLTFKYAEQFQKQY